MMASETGKKEKTNIQRIEAGLEVLFLFLSTIYLIYSFSTTTTTLYLPWPVGFQRFLLLAMALVAVGRIAFLGFKRVEPWLGLAIAAMYYMVYRSDGYSFLPFLAVLTVGFAGIDYRKILKMYVIAMGGFLAATVLAALSGSIINLVYFRNGVKSSWGVSYPTDFSSIYLFLLLVLWAAWREAPDWLMLLVSLTSVALAMFITRSRNSLACSALFSCVILYHWLESAVIHRHRGMRWLEKAVGGLLTAAFPLFAVVVFLMVFLYARETALGIRLNELLTDRLRLCLKDWQTYGLAAFGSPFDQIGYGLSAFPPENYDFIDSSYMLILLRYGWVTLLAYCGLWGWTIRRALRCGNRRLALAMGVIAFHSIVEQHFTEACFNILLVMPLAAYVASSERRRARPWERRTEAVVPAIILALLGLAGCFCLPWLVTRLRTVFQAMDWRGGEWGSLPAVVILLGIVAAVFASAAAFWRILRGIAAHKQLEGYLAAVLAACVVLCVGMHFLGEGVVDAAAQQRADMVEADAPALEYVLSAATGKVYVDDMPEVYMRCFDGISPTALSGEDLSRMRGATAVMDAGREYNIFFQMGFLYAQISETHAVYTDDNAVAEALAAAGYTVTDYYASAMRIDMEQEAARNELTLDARGLLLDGPAHSLIYGDYTELYGGLYEAEYSLALPEGMAGGEGDEAEIASLRICSNWGQDQLAQIPVYRSQFDKAGKLAVTVPFTTGIEPAMQFQVIMREGCRLYVEGISCRKVAGLS